MITVTRSSETETVTTVGANVRQAIEGAHRYFDRMQREGTLERTIYNIYDGSDVLALVTIDQDGQRSTIVADVHNRL